MAIRAPWAEQAAIAIQTSAVTQTSTFTAGTTDVDLTGAGTPEFGLALNSTPNIAVNMDSIDQRKTVGISQRKYGTGLELLPGGENTDWPTTNPKVPIRPSVTLEMDANVYNLCFFLWLLFQKGAYEDDYTYTSTDAEAVGQTFAKVFVPWNEHEASVTAEAWASFVRVMSSGTADSQKLDGCIVQSLTISSTEGEQVKLSVELVGRDLTPNFDWDAVASTAVLPTKTPIMHSDLFAIMGFETDYPDIAEFSVTLTNNAVGKTYNNAKINRWIINKIGVDGSIRMARDVDTIGDNTQLTNFVNGTDVPLILTNMGTAFSSVQNAQLEEGEFILAFNMHYTGPTITGDDELMNELPFTGVTGKVYGPYDWSCDAATVTANHYGVSGAVLGDITKVAAKFGAQATQVALNADGEYIEFLPIRTTDDIAVNDPLFLSFWFYCTAHTATNLKVGMYDANGAAFQNELTVTAATTGWRYFENYFKAPATITNLSFRVKQTGVGAVTIQLDNVIWGHPRACNIRIADNHQMSIPD